MKHGLNTDKTLNEINNMKKFVPAFLAIALAAGTILDQGCEDSSKNDALNQKIDELSKKVETVLQNQAQLQQVELKSQQDAIVSRIGSDNYYYTTNLLANVNDYH
jgi:outer membrane murein-binding lipoprotein Lpp